jgi:hypothetical protein
MIKLEGDKKLRYSHDSPSSVQVYCHPCVRLHLGSYLVEIRTGFVMVEG